MMFKKKEKKMVELTFYHDHIDINGADGWLWQPFPFLQDVRDFPGGDTIVRLPSKRHQLPDGDSW